MGEIKRQKPGIPVILAGCKSDLGAVVSEASINDFANKNNLKYVSTSSKSNIGIEELFITHLLPAIVKGGGGSQVVVEGIEKPKKKGGCHII